MIIAWIGLIVFGLVGIITLGLMALHYYKEEN